MKISILYVSQTGNTDTAADYIVDGILANYPCLFCAAAFSINCAAPPRG